MYTDNCCSSEVDYPCPEDPPFKTSPSLLSLLLLPPRALAASLCGAADIFKKTLEGGYRDKCALCGEDGCHEDCCNIPETCCPSPYVCKINWAGCPGDTLRYHVQVTNTGKISREFNLTPLAFPCSDERLTISPDKQTLEPGESFNAVASFTIPQTFGGGHYVSRIKVAGAYEQFIAVSLSVKPHQHCCCVIEQGEIPTRIKAHHWYHHFQCEVPCFEAVPARKPVPVPERPEIGTPELKPASNRPVKKGSKT